MRAEKVEVIIPIETIRKQRVTNQKEGVLNDYFKLLTFGELIDETTGIIEELNETKLSSDLATRSKMALQELGIRLSGQSNDFKNSFTQMRSQLEKKILDIQTHL